jgi:uncharacterized protein (DUF1697 family)
MSANVSTGRTLLADPASIGDDGAVPAMVALLRGVNIGGRKLAMADLRRIAEGCGHTDVKTYIQSGNVVFGSDSDDSARVADELHEAILADTGLDTAVTVRTTDEMEAVLMENPFLDRDDDPTHLHVAFHVGKGPSPRDWLDPAAYLPEELATVGDRTYLYLPGGMGRSKLATDFIRKSAQKGGEMPTARNWRTVGILAEMARAIDDAD